MKLKNSMRDNFFHEYFFLCFSSGLSLFYFSNKNSHKNFPKNKNKKKTAINCVLVILVFKTLLS